MQPDMQVVHGISQSGYSAMQRMTKLLTQNTSNLVEPTNAIVCQLCWLWTITTDQNLPTTQHHRPVHSPH